MMAHTVMVQTLCDIFANTLINESHDLVKITRHGAKDACRNYEGNILSLTGAIGGNPTLAGRQQPEKYFIQGASIGLVHTVVYNDNFLKKVI